MTDRVRIAGAKETRVNFGDTLDRVEAGERAIVTQRSNIAFVLVSMPFYDRIRTEIGEVPPAERDLKSTATLRNVEWTTTLAAVAAGKHVTLLRNSRASAVMIPPAYYNRFLRAVGEPELVLD